MPRTLKILAVFVVALEAVHARDADANGIVPETDLDQTGYSHQPQNHYSHQPPTRGHFPHRHNPHTHNPHTHGSSGKKPGCTKAAFIATLQTLKPTELKGAVKQAGLKTDDLVQTGWASPAHSGSAVVGQHGHWPHAHRPHKHAPSGQKPGCNKAAFIATLQTLKPTELKGAWKQAGLKTDDLVQTGWGHVHHPHKHAPSGQKPGCTKAAFIATLQTLKPTELKGAVKQAGLKTDDLVQTGWASHVHHPHKHAPSGQKPGCNKAAFIATLQTLKPTELKGAWKQAGLKTDDLVPAGYLSHVHHPHKHAPATKK